jgi:hypothetical protein
MMFVGTRVSRLCLAALACAVLVVGNGSIALAEPVTPRTYPGTAYSSELPLPPTRAENQSKVWFHADAWWAMLLEREGRTVRVFELMPDHQWRATPAVVNPDAGDTGDAVVDGDAVHVVSRRRDGSLYYVRLVFDPDAGEYRSEEPLIVTTRGSNSTATIAKDTAGRLWVSYATVNNVVVTYTDDGGRSWGRFNVLANTGTGETPETAALVPYDDRIGLLWSNQGAGAFEFASHRDGDDPDAWVREPGPAGEAQADNHISLTRIPGDPSDTLVAAVKTSQNDRTAPPDAPLIEVLVRAPDGFWSKVTVATVADRMDDPVLAVDEETRTLHVFASQGGDIVTKQAPLDDLQFEAGLSHLFVLGSGSGLVDPTVAKAPVNATSGLVVLASDATNREYRHAELPIVSAEPTADPDDSTPPNPPGNLQGRALSPETVVLTWGPATDGDRWVAAGTGVPVREYVVLRDGEEVARVPSTSVQDRVPGAEEGMSVEYAVQAVDQSGNRSPATRVVIDLPEPGVSPGTLVGLWLLVAAAIAGLYGFLRRRLAEGMTTDRPGRDFPDRTDVREPSLR